MRKIFTLFLLLTIAGVMKAQDPSFSQFYANRIYLNPAFTGLEQGLSFAGVYRVQWRNVDDGFRSYMASVELKEPFIRSGFGLTFFQDVQGLAELTSTSIGLSYAYTIQMDNHNVHVGMQALWNQKSLDWSKIIFSDQLDPVLGNVYSTSAIQALERVSFTDFNIGAIWRFKANMKLGHRRFKETHNSIGISLHHAPSLFAGTRGNESFQNLETRTAPRITLHAGSIIPAFVVGAGRKRISFSPNIKYDIQGENVFTPSQSLQVLTYGCYVLYEGVYLGAMYQNKFLASGFRHTNAMILTLGAYVDTGRRDSNTYFVGFSYDANATGVGTRAGGVYEVAFRWTIANAPTIFGGIGRSRSKQILDCHHFF
ncbi:MAG: PorP/SprF family type IX secretion system membrane protein [Bacteroidota bacterium]